MMAAEFPLTFFNDHAARLKRETMHSPEGVVRRISEMVAPEKAKLPWLKMAQFGSNRTRQGSLRHDDNVLAISGVEGDYDSEQTSFDDAVEIAEKADLGCIIYTSPSHVENKPRWRVLAPTSRLLLPSDRDAMMARVNGLYGGIFAPESFTLSQSYYYGHIAGSRDHRAVAVDGTCVDQLDDLDLIAIGKAGGARASDSEAGAAGTESREDSELVRRIVTGEGFHTELTAMAARCIGRGISPDAVVSILHGLMLAHPEPARDDRWVDRYLSIEGLVRSAQAKFGGGAEGRRAIARMTHRMAQQRRPAEEIRDAVLFEAERRRISADTAITIAGAILRDKAEGRRHG